MANRRGIILVDLGRVFTATCQHDEPDIRECVMKRLAALSATMTMLMTACEQPPVAVKTPVAPTMPAAIGAENFNVDAALGFSLAVPRGMHLQHDFDRSYLDAATWKAFAEPGSRCKAAAALVLEGSNKITAAELRVGVSPDPAAVRHCTDVPASGLSTGSDTVNHGGTDFVHFHAADAAMSHYLQVEGYRAVHAGRCYAIDLWISGTRPEVYDPPKPVPLAREDAMRQLHDAPAGFRYVD
jgi:hypothetical protein